ATPYPPKAMDSILTFLLITLKYHSEAWDSIVPEVLISLTSHPYFVSFKHPKERIDRFDGLV
ncbi:MAG: hypothetical protein Q7U55_08460, partial [Deltaproteobacteria bacterium]|nr:hypothetical protein [Deltaproteobacteria bacterium]